MLTLPETLTHREARATLAALVPMLAQADGAEVIVDAHALQTFDSSALAVLLELRRQARAAGRSLAVRGLPPKARLLAQVYGVDALLPADATASRAA